MLENLDKFRAAIQDKIKSKKYMKEYLKQISEIETISTDYPKVKTVKNTDNNSDIHIVLPGNETFHAVLTENYRFLLTSEKTGY